MNSRRRIGPPVDVHSNACLQQFRSDVDRAGMQKNPASRRRRRVSLTQRQDITVCDTSTRNCGGIGKALICPPPRQDDDDLLGGNALLALSIQIQELEEELGVQLLQRAIAVSF